MLHGIVQGSFYEFAALGWPHGLCRTHQIVRAAGLDLHKGKILSIQYDEVDLPVSEAPAPLQDGTSGLLQPAGRMVLAEPP